MKLNNHHTNHRKLLAQLSILAALFLAGCDRNSSKSATDNTSETRAEHSSRSGSGAAAVDDGFASPEEVFEAMKKLQLYEDGALFTSEDRMLLSYMQVMFAYALHQFEQDMDRKRAIEESFGELLAKHGLTDKLVITENEEKAKEAAIRAFGDVDTLKFLSDLGTFNRKFVPVEESDMVPVSLGELTVESDRAEATIVFSDGTEKREVFVLSGGRWFLSAQSILYPEEDMEIEFGEITVEHTPAPLKLTIRRVDPAPDLGLPAPVRDSDKPRIWTSGAYQVEAQFVRLEDGMVILRKSKDGKNTNPIPLEKLSEDDQELARVIAAQDEAINHLEQDLSNAPLNKQKEAALYRLITLLAAKNAWEDVNKWAKQYLMTEGYHKYSGFVSHLLAQSYDNRAMREDAIAVYSMVFGANPGQIEVSAPAVARVMELTWARNRNEDRQIAYEIGYGYGKSTLHLRNQMTAPEKVLWQRVTDLVEQYADTPGIEKILEE